jgi:hypothetical protein
MYTKPPFISLYLAILARYEESFAARTRGCWVAGSSPAMVKMGEHLRQLNLNHHPKKKPAGQGGLLRLRKSRISSPRHPSAAMPA